MIRVLIADDHAIVRQGLKQILSETDDLIVAGEADDGVHALRLARDQACDVFLLDISMPNRNGIETLKQLKKEFPKLPVLILSMHSEEHYAVRALKSGASGYLTKQSAPEQLVTAIRKVASGKKYVSSAVAEQLVNAIDVNNEQLPHELLTDREFEVLKLIAAGLPLTQIAEKLNLAVPTISTFRARIIEKTGLKSNSDIIRYALEQALI